MLRLYVKKLRAAGIGYISQVNAAIGAASEMPYQKCVYGPKQQFSGRRFLFCTSYVLQHPTRL